MSCGCGFGGAPATKDAPVDMPDVTYDKLNKTFTVKYSENHTLDDLKASMAMAVGKQPGKIALEVVSDPPSPAPTPAEPPTPAMSPAPTGSPAPAGSPASPNSPASEEAEESAASPEASAQTNADSQREEESAKVIQETFRQHLAAKDGEAVSLAKTAEKKQSRKRFLNMLTLLGVGAVSFGSYRSRSNAAKATMSKPAAPTQAKPVEKRGGFKFPTIRLNPPSE